MARQDRARADRRRRAPRSDRPSGGGATRGRGDELAGAGRIGDTRYKVYVAALLTMIIALLSVSTVFTVRIVQARSSVERNEDRREAVLSAARQQALNFTTISHKTVDSDIDRVIKGATGDFKASYKNNRKTIKETVTKNESTSKGEVLGAGIKSLDSDSAVTLVVVDASVKNVAHEKPTLQNYRMQFDMAKLKNGKWLVSGVEFVG